MRVLLSALAAVSAASFCCWAPAAAAAPADERTWHFRVFLDDREIGYHDFTVRSTPDGEVVDSDADFQVKFLFINAFKYRHHSEERWRDGCLREIEAFTRTNGDRNRVEGQVKNGDFVLRAASIKKSERDADLAADRYDRRRLDTDCPSTFAYWDRSFIDRERLLNPQTGEIVPVQITRLGKEEMQVSGVRTPVLRYRIDMPDGEIQVCYTRAGGRWEWVALESKIEGRTLRYQREGGEELPVLLSAATVDDFTDEPTVAGGK